MYTERDMLTDIRDSISKYLNETPTQPCPPSAELFEINKSGTYRDCVLHGQINITAPDVIFENVTLEGTNPDYTLLTAFHGTQLRNCTLIGSPNGQHRGVRVDARGIRLINTVVKNIWSGAVSDTQAVAGWNGCKDLIIDGGEYWAAGENILFGGARCDSEENIPQNILIQNAIMDKDLEWRKKLRGETVKYIFELKNAKRLTLKNCKLKHCWGDGLQGDAFGLTVRQQEQLPGKEFCVIEDILIHNNEIESVGGGFNILGNDDEHLVAGNPFKNVRIVDNDFKDFDMNKWNGSGKQFQIGLGSRNLQLVENYFDGPKAGFYTIITFYGYEPSKPNIPFVNWDFKFIDNRVSEGQYAVHGANVPVTGVIEALERYAPDYVWSGNTVENQSGDYTYPS